MKEEEVKKMAEDHWEYVEKICKMMYITAFIHGVKHGKEEKNK